MAPPGLRGEIVIAGSADSLAINRYNIDAAGDVLYRMTIERLHTFYATIVAPGNQFILIAQAIVGCKFSAAFHPRTTGKCRAGTMERFRDRPPSI